MTDSKNISGWVPKAKTQMMTTMQMTQPTMHRLMLLLLGRLMLRVHRLMLFLLCRLILLTV